MNVEWKAYLLTYFRTTVHVKSDTLIRWGWAQVQKDAVTEESVDLAYGEEACEVPEFSSRLHS